MKRSTQHCLIAMLTFLVGGNAGLDRSAFAEDPPGADEIESLVQELRVERERRQAEAAHAARVEEQRELDERRAWEVRELLDGVLRDADLASSALTQPEPEFRLDFAAFQDDAVPESADQGPEGDNTGTDPRDFANKFMPYYRYAENKNGVYINQFVMFGLFAFDPRFAMTYELPVAKRINYGTDFMGTDSGSNPDFPANGIPGTILESDGDSTGMGDLILRFFSRPEAWEWKYNESEPDSWSIMPTIEFTLPTATDDVIGSESFIISPAITIVADIPGGPPFGLGFVAFMNFYDFTAWKDNSRGNVSRYRGRWFWMQPLAKPGPNLLDGIYVLTEFQPIYDFMTSDFDAWIGPEFGKIVKDGFIVYAKPGWGIDPEPNDRDFTFEVGMRIFY